MGEMSPLVIKITKITVIRNNNFTLYLHYASNSAMKVKSEISPFYPRLRTKTKNTISYIIVRSLLT